MIKKKTFVNMIFILSAFCCLAVSAAKGSERFAANGSLTAVGFSAVPAAGTPSLIWVGAALIVVALGIIFLALSRRRK